MAGERARTKMQAACSISCAACWQAQLQSWARTRWTFARSGFRQDDGVSLSSHLMCTLVMYEADHQSWCWVI
jgi:hypothetical protein